MLLLFILAVVTRAVLAFECGVANGPGDGRIVGGSDIGYYKYPWFASLHPKGQVNSAVCAGALITSRHVISAAHCFPEPSFLPQRLRYDVTLGTDNRCNLTSTAQTFSVAEVTVHEEYITSTSLNDISIITLNTDANFMAVCLPPQGEPITFESEATIAGFGVTQFSTFDQPCEMQEAQVTIFTNEQCLSSRIPTSEVNYMMKEGSAFCAGKREGGVDTCQGDSGGPLIVKENNRYVQKGIVSFGYGCGEPNMPGIYTNVASHIKWISKTTEGESNVNKPAGQGNIIGVVVWNVISFFLG